MLIAYLASQDQRIVLFTQKHYRVLWKPHFPLQHYYQNSLNGLNVVWRFTTKLFQWY